MLHAAFILVFVLVAAPLLDKVPLAALAAVLLVVAWNMIEWEEIGTILRTDRGDAAILAITVVLTVFRDVSQAIAAGVTLGSLLFMHRMASMVETATLGRLVDEDQPDRPRGVARTPGIESGIVVFSLAGPVFFGAAGGIAQLLDQMGTSARAFILDLTSVPLVDTTGARSLLRFIEKAEMRGLRVHVAGASKPVLRSLLANGLTRRRVAFSSTLALARERARAR